MAQGHKWWILSEKIPEDIAVMVSEYRNSDQNNNQANRFCTDVIRQKDTAVTFDQAVVEMEGQLQRLKMHRSRLGY